MPKISVVIPTYNRADLISETLDSVLAQTYRDFEVIVVDDGSTDDTIKLLSKYGQDIRIIGQENQGAGSARNTGIREAKGEFIAFLDSDDLWLPKKLERQIAFLDRNRDLSWVYTDVEVFDGESGRKLYILGQCSRLYEGDILPYLFLKNFIPSSTLLVRRSIFNEIGAFKTLPMAQDCDMWLRIAALYPVGLIAEPLARYRIHRERISSGHKWKTKFNIHITIIEQACAREPARLAPIKNQAFSQLCLKTGSERLSAGNLTEALQLFAQAIRLSPGTLKTYLYLLACFTGPFGTKTAIRIGRWLKSYAKSKC